MFKDFHRRLQRDLKKIVDARVHASDSQFGGEIKVNYFIFFNFPCNIFPNRFEDSQLSYLYFFGFTSHNRWKSMWLVIPFRDLRCGLEALCLHQRLSFMLYDFLLITLAVGLI